jgi:predicted metalloendopeptidase
MCGLGVTVILPDGERYKAQETQEVRHQIREYTERKLRQSDNENEEVT